MKHLEKPMRTALIILALLIVLAGAFLISRFGLFERGLAPGEKVDLPGLSQTAEERGAANLTPTQEGMPAKNPERRVETVVSGLDTPWSLVFTSDTRMLVTERPGQIRVIEEGRLLDRPLHSFSEVAERGEQGLLSLTLDPAYPENKLLYVVLAYPSGSGYLAKVVRFRDEGDRLANETTLLDRIPAAQNHAGSRLAFGPDGKLYVTTGDASTREIAQDKGSLGGKILRLNSDGSVPADNPFGNPVWSYGHRNPQGLAWHPDTGALYSTEHGPSGFDGPGGGDEVNLIEKGKNYGWPLVSHERRLAGTEPPVIVFTPAEAPASLMIYSGRVFPEWRGQLFFGALRGEGLVHITLDPEDPKRVKSYEKLSDVRFGRIRDVAEGPDGYIYFTTSNRDGRGKPAAADDRIFRIRPK